MALLDLWNTSPHQVRDKQLQQLIAFAGLGKLIDGSDCSHELRAFLSTVTSDYLVEYAEQCLSQSFPDSGLALQDVVNEIGTRIGAVVTQGRYRGKPRTPGHDGLWRFPSNHAIIVEVKTTDAYRIDLDVIAGYRKTLIEEETISESLSSMLLIVGRQDTGDLEAQIRGSRHAWDLRIISVEALLRLMRIKEEVEDPLIIQRIHDILIPREFTRVDEIANILFSAAQDIKQETVKAEQENHGDGQGENSPRLTPVAFHDACITRIALQLKCPLLKRTRSQYSNPEKTVLVNCAVSKEHESESNPNYWFAFHPHQRDALEQAHEGYVAFGCGASEQTLLIPYPEFASWIDGMWTTTKGERTYWHVSIYRVEGKLLLRRKKGEGSIDVSHYLLMDQH